MYQPRVESCRQEITPDLFDMSSRTYQSIQSRHDALTSAMDKINRRCRDRHGSIGHRATHPGRLCPDKNLVHPYSGAGGVQRMTLTARIELPNRRAAASGRTSRRRSIVKLRNRLESLDQNDLWPITLVTLPHLIRRLPSHPRLHLPPSAPESFLATF